MTKTNAAILGALFTTLANEQYQFRTVSAVQRAIPENFGVTTGCVLSLLGEHSDTFVTKTRRSDGAALVAVRHRNAFDYGELETIGVALTALSDGRYEFRSVAAIAEKAGVSAHGAEVFIEGATELFVTKTRRSDGATLVGLAA